MKSIFILIFILISCIVYCQEDYIMFDKTEKQLIEYRKNINTQIIKISKDTSGVLTFYYTPNNKQKMYDVYYIKNKICVGYTEYYPNNRPTRKTLITKLNLKYKQKEKYIWENDNMTIYFYKYKKIIIIDYIPTKDYLIKKMLKRN